MKMGRKKTLKRHYAVMKKIEHLKKAVEKNRSLSEYFNRNHLYTLEKIVLKKLKVQEHKMKNLLDNEFSLVNYEIAKQKKVMEGLSVCRIHILEHLDPQRACVYVRLYHQGRF